MVGGIARASSRGFLIDTLMKFGITFIGEFLKQWIKDYLKEFLKDFAKESVEVFSERNPWKIS